MESLIKISNDKTTFKLKVIQDAKQNSFKNILIMEDDVRPVKKYDLSSMDMYNIIESLKYSQWDILRLASYPKIFSMYQRHKTCTKECKCQYITSRLCKMKSICDMRNTEAYAVHHKAFSKFPNVYHGNLWYDQWLSRGNWSQLYIMPQIFVQQIKQGDVHMTEIFKKKCFLHP